MGCSRCQGLMVDETLFNPTEGVRPYVGAGRTLSQLRQSGRCADPIGPWHFAPSGSAHQARPAAERRVE